MLKILLLGLILLLLGAGGYYLWTKNFQSSNPTNIVTSPAPSSKSFPTPEASESATLEINLNLPGVTLQKVESDTKSYPIHFYKDFNKGFKSFELPIQDVYYVVFQGTSDPNDRFGIFSQELERNGWAQEQTVNGYQLRGIVADGVCGGISGFVGYEKGQVRQIVIGEHAAPCKLPDGNTISSDGNSGGIYLYISEKINFDQMISQGKYPY